MARRWVWIVGGGLIAVVVAAGVAAVAFALTRGAGWVGDRASAATGRNVEIGSLDIDWGRAPIIRLTDVSVANVDWGEAEHLLTVRDVRIQIRLLPLLTGRIELPQVIVDGGSLAIERRADGEGNWSFSSSPGAAAAAEGVQPEERSEVPTIGRLRISDGKVSVRDAERELRLDGTINTAVGDAEGADRLELAVDGRLAGKPLKAAFRGGSILMLRDSEEPYPVDLEVTFGDTRLTVEGTFKDPVAFEGAEVRMSLAGPSLAEVFPLLSIPAPPTPPYEIAGRLQRNGAVWQLADMAGKIGNSDIAGVVAVDHGRDPPMLRAELVARRLDFDDLAPLVGVPPGGEAASAEQRENLFPDTRLNVERLRAMDMDVTLSADEVNARSYLPVDTVHFRIRVEDGRAEANPLRFGVAGGVIEGAIAVNGRTEVPSADLDLRLSGLGLAQFFEGTDFYETMGGDLQGRLYLIGSGHSLAELMASADGDGALVMTDGSLSGLLIEGAGLDLGQALILVIGDDDRIPIRCALVSLAVTDGRVDIRRGIVDTTDSALYVRGGGNLADQTIDLDVEADAKDFSLLDIDAPVHFEGKIRAPEISIGEGVPIPILELGDGEDVPCQPLIEEFMRAPEKDR